MTRFAAPIAEQIWDMKYRLKDTDGTPVDADALADLDEGAPWPERRIVVAAANDSGYRAAGALGDTGLDGVLLDSEIIACAADAEPEASDDLVEDQHDAVFGTGLTYTFEEAFDWRDAVHVPR